MARAAAEARHPEPLRERVRAAARAVARPYLVVGESTATPVGSIARRPSRSTHSPQAPLPTLRSSSTEFPVQPECGMAPERAPARVAVDAMADQRAAEAVAPGGVLPWRSGRLKKSRRPAARIQEPVERDPVGPIVSLWTCVHGSESSINSSIPTARWRFCKLIRSKKSDFRRFCRAL